MYPDLKDALEKQDRAALPKRDDADVKQAAKLIDAIRDYKAALQKTADEVKDEQIKTNLKKRLTKWDASQTPTNQTAVVVPQIPGSGKTNDLENAVKP